MDECEYTVHTDPAAYGQMVSHVLFLARVSITAAERLYDNLCEGINSLDFNPERYPIYITSKTPGIVFRYKLYAKRYRIVFEIDGNDVYVHDVQDCRQDTDKHLV